MFGPRIGPVVRPRVGVAVGNDPLRHASDALVTDSESGKGVPLTQEEWDAVFTDARVESKTVGHSWGLQDASGHPVATVGTNLVAAGTLTYEQAITGWTRKAIRIPQTANTGIGLAAAAGPNAATTSVLWMAYIDITATPGATRIVLSASSNATDCRIMMTTGPVPRLSCAGVNADGASDPITGGVRPYVLVYDRTAETVSAYTDQEKIAGTFAAVVDGNKGIPGTTVTGPPMDVLWGVAFAGANAEWTDDDVRDVLTTLGWSPAW